MSEKSTNNRSYIRSRVDSKGYWRTETKNRDEGTLTAAVTTNPKTNKTRFFVDFAKGDSVSFSGQEALTLFNVLKKHYFFKNNGE